jgi:molecular chaperone DnaK
VTITASTNLSKDEIERKIREGREHEAEDKRQRELIQARNTADSLVYQTEKTLHELQDKVPTADRQNVEMKLNQLRDAMKGNDTHQINSLTSDIQNAFYALSQQLYAAQTSDQPGNGKSAGTSSNGNGHKPRNPDDEGEILEGEFREM